MNNGELAVMNNGELDALAGGLALFLGVFFLVASLLSLVIVVSTWKLFTKAGVEGWKSLIPIYNQWVTIQIAFSNTKNWLILALVLNFFSGFATGLDFPYVGYLLLLAASIANIYISYNFIRRFASKGMAVLSIFLPLIIYPIVAFSSKFQYEKYKENSF